MPPLPKVLNPKFERREKLMVGRMLVFILVLLSLGMGGCAKPKEEVAKEPKVSEPGEVKSTEVKTEYERPIVTIETTKGNIVLELFPQEAPKATENFIKLANQGFYNGCTFHRVVKNFVIQGGDPNSKDDDPNNDGMGGPGYEFEDEPVIRDYKKGTLAMANHGPNTNGSQFFICLKDLPTLPKKYTIFGQVLQGLKVVEEIGEVPTNHRERPLEKVMMKKVTVREGK